MNGFTQPQAVDLLLPILDVEISPIGEIRGRENLAVQRPVQRRIDDASAIDNLSTRHQFSESGRVMQAPLKIDIKADKVSVDVSRNGLLMLQGTIGPRDFGQVLPHDDPAVVADGRAELVFWDVARR